jgi:hypothetical protein
MNNPDNPNNSNNPATLAVFWKAIASIVMWVMIAVSFVATAIFLVPQMGEEALGAVFMLLAAGVVCSGFIWNWGSTGQRKLDKKVRESAEDELYNLASSVGEKRKRDRLAVSLSHLSDNELLDLRQKLRNGDLDEQELAEILNQQG